MSSIYDESGNIADDVQIESDAVLTERRKTYGIWADCGISTDGNTVRVVIDDPLPNEDRVIIETSREKASAVLTKAVAGDLIGQADTIKFFK